MPSLCLGRITTIVLATVAFGWGCQASAQQGISLRSPLDVSSGGTLLGNRPGMSIGRTPRSAYIRDDVIPPTRPDQLVPPPPPPDYPLSNPREIKETADHLLGDPKGWTLEQVISLMNRQNLDITVARSEVDQARSDIITAGLRTNPQFFTDMQQIPYRVLAPAQADVNVAYPVDVSGKRKTRVKSAVCNLRTIEWKYQNFVRTQIDVINTIFIDTLVAQVMFDEYTKQKKDTGGVTFDPNQKSGLDESETNLRDGRRQLGLLLNLSNPDAIKLKGVVFDPRTFPETGSTKDAWLVYLKSVASANRPDLQSQRWTLCRAQADVDSVRASRLDDVTFLVQPYTFSPALPNRAGWALGVTIPLPIYNRQQGNLAKAQQIVAQTHAQLTSLENSVAAEVEAAYNAITDTQGDLERFLNKRKKNEFETPPDLTKAENQPDDPKTLTYLDVMSPYLNEMIKRDRDLINRNYYNALIQHRKSLLRMNTACAITILPVDDVEHPAAARPSTIPAARIP